MSALKQPSAAWNCSCFDWTSSAHISVGSGMPQHSKIVPITAGRLNSQQPHEQVLVPIRNESFVQISYSDLLLLLGVLPVRAHVHGAHLRLSRRPAVRIDRPSAALSSISTINLPIAYCARALP